MYRDPKKPLPQGCQDTKTLNLVPLSPLHWRRVIQVQLGAPRVQFVHHRAQHNLQQVIARHTPLRVTPVRHRVDNVPCLGLLVQLVVQVLKRLLALDVGPAQAEQLDAHLVRRSVESVQLPGSVDDGSLDVVIEGTRRQNDEVQGRALLARLELFNVPLQELSPAALQRGVSRL